MRLCFWHSDSGAVPPDAGGRAGGRRWASRRWAAGARRGARRARGAGESTRRATAARLRARLCGIGVRVSRVAGEANDCGRSMWRSASHDETPATDARLVQRVADALPVVVQQAPVHLQERQSPTSGRHESSAIMISHWARQSAQRRAPSAANIRLHSTHHQLNGTIFEAGPSLRAIVEYGELQIPR